MSGAAVDAKAAQGGKARTTAAAAWKLVQRKTAIAAAIKMPATHPRNSQRCPASSKSWLGIHQGSPAGSNAASDMLRGVRSFLIMMRRRVWEKR